VALAINAASPAMVAGNTTTITSAAFTAPAQSFLLALVGRNVTGAGVNGTGTVAGAGVTWTLAGQKTDYASATKNITGGTNQPTDVELWWAYTAAGFTSQSVTDTRADGLSGVNLEHAMQVQVLTGAETAWGGAIAATGANTGTPSLALTTTGAGSWVYSVSTDWNSMGAGTPGSGQTIVNEYTVSGQITIHFWRQTATTTTSGTAVTQSLTAPTPQLFNMLDFEVRQSTATASLPQRARSVQRVAGIRAANF
jgi:hypothetical protein